MRTQRRGTDEEGQKERRGFWQRWALGVMKRPVLIILLVTVLLVGLGWPIFSISIGTTNYTSVPNNSDARQGMDILNAQLREINERPIYVVAQSPSGSSMLHANTLTKLDNLPKWISA